MNIFSNANLLLCVTFLSCAKHFDAWALEELRLQKEPKQASEVVALLKPGERFSLQESPQKKQDWFEVSFRNERGFLAYDAINSDKVIIMLPEDDTAGSVTVPVLMVREAPLLGAKVIGQLEEGEIVEIKEQSRFGASIRGVNGQWLKIILADGRNGYAFGGYMEKGKKDELLALQKSGFVKIKGFVRFGVPNPKFYKDPESLRLDPEQKFGLHSFNGYIAQISEKRVINKQTYFRINEYICPGAENCRNIDVWVSDKEARYIADIFLETKRKFNGLVPQTGLAQINAAMDGKLNVEELNCRTAKTTGGLLHICTTRNFNGSGPVMHFALFSTGNRASLLKHGHTDRYLGQTEVIDLDNDGLHEFYAFDFPFAMGEPVRLYVYCIANTVQQPVFSAFIPDPNAYEFNPPYLTLRLRADSWHYDEDLPSYPFGIPGNERHFKFEGCSFKEVQDRQLKIKA
ncbi:MAG: SH3 domain-containing protein [Spirochaetales bacterium]|nr:SH3 domain-containing protein [Spirochaetales bacterium]